MVCYGISGVVNCYLKAFNLIQFDKFYYRVRTFKTFSRHFSKTIFSRLKVTKQVVNRDLEKPFFQNALQMSETTVQCGQRKVMTLLIL